MQLALEQPKDLFAVLGERVRLRLACCLLTEKNGLAVCEMVDALKEPQPNLSRHLKLMKSAGLVDEQRDGRWIYYRLKDADHPFFDNLRCCLETVCCCNPRLRSLRSKRPGTFSLYFNSMIAWFAGSA